MGSGYEGTMVYKAEASTLFSSNTCVNLSYEKGATSAGPMVCFKCTDLDIPIPNFSFLLNPN